MNKKNNYQLFTANLHCLKVRIKKVLSIFVLIYHFLTEQRCTEALFIWGRDFFGDDRRSEALLLFSFLFPKKQFYSFVSSIFLNFHCSKFVSHEAIRTCRVKKGREAKKVNKIIAIHFVRTRTKESFHNELILYDSFSYENIPVIFH